MKRSHFTFIQAGPENTKGWTTNPAIKGTDGDGWNDYKEIFIYDSNPISVDMDGDGAWDPIDRDPKRDVMLEISPISASVPTERNLQIVATVSLDSGEDYVIYSLKKSADYYQSSEYHAYFDGTHGSSMELHYYVDINDCKQTQGNSISFNLQLWNVDRYWGFIKKWDHKLLSADRNYYIQTPGHLTQYTIYDTNYEFKVNVKTIGVEKANTIAIYETNGTVFNGHYQDQEKMNIIQLYVNDSGDGTPFVEGPNVIVIPTSLFTETVFNAHVQNETLNETPIYSVDEEIFKFISIGREGNTEQACDEVDFVFIRFDISSQDALEILNLLLTCIINETTNETAITYSYVSTKENETSAAIMNLPISVLGYIPWFCNFSDSAQGNKPKDFEDWFWSSLKALGKAIIGFIVTIVMLIVELVKLIIDFIMDILMESLPLLAYILWLIIRVAILIFIWIRFIMTLLIILLLFGLMVFTFMILSVITQITIAVSINSLTLLNQDKYFKFEYTIGMEHWDLFDLTIPTIYLNFKDNNTSNKITLNFINGATLSAFDNLLPDLFIGKSQSSSVIKSASTLEKNNFTLKSSSISPTVTEWFSGFFLAADITGLFIAIMGAIVLGTEGFWQWFGLLGTIVLSIITLSIFYLNKEYTGISPAWASGFIAGPLFSLALMFVIAIIVDIKSVGKNTTTIKKIFNILGYILLAYTLILGIIEIIEFVTGADITFLNFLEESFSLETVLGFVGIFIGAVSIGLDDDTSIIITILAISIIFYVRFLALLTEI